MGGSFWETEYLGSPEYRSGQWQVSFIPPSEADLGTFSFRVRFGDGEDESAWAYSNGSFLLKNNPPSVDIKNSGLQEDKTVSFSATVSDSEDSRSSLSYLWDFDDGDTSTSDGPLHTFEKSGTYTVSLTVTDSDGAEITDTSEIIIEGDVGIADQDETGDMVTLVILLVVVAIIVVLVLVLLLRKKKKKPEETRLPETTQGVVQPVTAPPPPTYETPSPPPPSQKTPPPPPPKVQPPAPSPTSPPIHTPQIAITQAQSQKNIKCPKCKQTFKIPLTKGTQRITCPHCGTSGNISL